MRFSKASLEFLLLVYGQRHIASPTSGLQREAVTPAMHGRLNERQMHFM